jgi:hypothetical protein
VTNNTKPALRAATLKEATFPLPAEETAMTISLQYFNCRNSKTYISEA